MQATQTLIGPFRQLLTMQEMPNRGALKDEQLEVLPDAGVLVEGGQVVQVGLFKQLKAANPKAMIHLLKEDLVGLPGLIDCHTHICYGGSRAMDYAARNNGKTYLEIAKAGGGIWSTVNHTRTATEEELGALMRMRLDKLAHIGVTTVEVKSGYGLSVEAELKQLNVIKQVGKTHTIDVVPTCLAAHIVPKDIGDEAKYLELIVEELVPIIQKQSLAKRFDIFIEESAFSVEASTDYLNRLRSMGFQLTVHGDQFSTGGSQVAIDCGALSVDHLEVSGDKEIEALAQSNTIPVALPGASIGLGCSFTPARKLLDAGCSLAIASDWNPGSAPQGNLLAQAAILGTFEKLSTAEILAGLTYRSALALGLTDRGRLTTQQKADIVAFPGTDYREILYHQGELKPKCVWKNGVLLNLSLTKDNGQRTAFPL